MGNRNTELCHFLSMFLSYKRRKTYPCSSFPIKNPASQLRSVICIVSVIDLTNQCICMIESKIVAYLAILTMQFKFIGCALLVEAPPLCGRYCPCAKPRQLATACSTGQSPRKKRKKKCYVVFFHVLNFNVVGETLSSHF